MTQINIVGLDPSETRSSMVRFYGESSALPEAEPGPVEVQFTGTQKTKHEDRGDRLLWYRSTFSKYFQERHSVIAYYNVVCIEGYSFGSRNKTQHSGEHGALVRLAALDHGWTVIICPPSALKRLTSGKGNAPKETMMRDVHVKWRYLAEDNNDADAYGLMRIAHLWCLSREFDARINKQIDTIIDALEVWRAR